MLPPTLSGDRSSSLPSVSKEVMGGLGGPLGRLLILSLSLVRLPVCDFTVSMRGC